MAEKRTYRKMSAILSADVKGYSRLMSDNEEGTVQTLNQCREIITRTVQNHRGRVVDSPGDNVLAEFVSIVEAVKCAVKIQEDLKVRNDGLPDSSRMVFRVGVNLGDVIEENGRIYGDGVNIAARLEGLAEAGGVCISRAVFDQVKGKLEVGYKFLGAHKVKNLAEPVRAYKVLTEPEAAGKIIGENRKPKWWISVAAAFILLLGLAGWYVYNGKQVLSFKEARTEEPSIAVLPFENMSSDPEQAYFGDGISEDLITDLSKIPDLLVISRLSSFTYKGKSVKIQQIAEELGVRYVLEGSVRKANGNVRINAQLIDAATGHHLWAERYDGHTSGIFDLQDKITRKITGALSVTLTEDVKNRLNQKDTGNMEAYEAYLKGVAIADSLRNDAGKFAQSLPWFERAVELDAEYSEAYAALAETYIFGSLFGIQNKLEISKRLVYLRGINYLRMAMKNPTNRAYRTAGRVNLYRRQHEKAIDNGMRAIALGPNDYRSNAFMATFLIAAGRSDEALAFTERMRRADPFCLW